MPAYYFGCVCLSLLVSVVRPGEIFPVLAITRPAIVSFGLVALAFFACSGPQRVQRMAPAGAGPMKWLLFLGFAGIVFSVYPRQALQSWIGMLIQIALYYFWLPAVGTFTGLRRCVTMLAFCAACLVVAMRFMAAVGVSTGRISVGASYDPNDIAMVLATLFPFVAYAFVQGGLRARLFCTALMGGIMLGILSTGSRGGLLALGVAGALLAFTPGTGVKIWHKLFVVVLAAGFFMSPAADKVKKRFQEVLSGRDYNLDTSEKTGGGRLMIWSDALKAIAERPLTGVGVGNATTAMGAEYHRWMTVHNSYLQVGVELGVPGLIVFLLLLRTIWRNCREAHRVFMPEPDMRYAALLATCTRIALVTYVVGAFFLSQAYSVVVPILLLLSNGLVHSSRTRDETSYGPEYGGDFLVEGAQPG
ncbi:MAG: O-antigen ligase family protein [Thermoguttaceae bacterium]